MAEPENRGSGRMTDQQIFEAISERYGPNCGVAPGTKLSVIRDLAILLSVDLIDEVFVLTDYRVIKDLARALTPAGRLELMRSLVAGLSAQDVQPREEVMA